MQLLIKNIKALVKVDDTQTPKLAGKAMNSLNTIENAYLFIENDKISAYGPMSEAPTNAETTIDATGKMVFPGFVDSHTHIVYAASREEEFVDRINGLSYEEIAKRGGGILNSAEKMQHADEDELFEQAMIRLNEIMRMGTVAVEIKSGYGLTAESELKMLRVIKRLKDSHPLTIKSTFLGAHAFPAAYKDNHAGYIDLIIKEMLPAIEAEGLADYIDVFCDRGFFSPIETHEILKAGARYGLKAKVHAHELDFSGGVRVGVKNKAVSVDHLEFTSEAEIGYLLNSDTMPTLLPSTAFFLNLEYAPARKMIDLGLPIALASDYNPGSSPSGNMSFVLALACIKMGMTPEEVINAATINSAYAIELQDHFGSITVGKKASVFISKPIDSIARIPYSFGSNLVDQVIIEGKVV